MNIKNKLPKGLVLVGLGDTIGNGFSALFWLIIASLLLPSEYGEISYVLAIAGLVSMIALFSTQNTIVVYNAKNVKLNSTFNTISLVGGIIGLAAIGIIQNRLDTGFLIIGYIMHILGTGYIIGRKQFNFYLVLVILQKFLTFALGIGFYYAFGPDSIILALGLSYIGYSYIIYKGFRDSTFNLSLLKEKIKFVTNNYLLSVISGLHSQIDKLLIGPILGFTILGNYALSFQLMIILFVIPGIVFKYTLSHDATGERNKKLKQYTILFSVLLSILTIILAPYIIPQFFPKYEDVIEAIQIMSLSVIPFTIISFYTSKLLGMEKSKIVLIGNSVQTGVFVSSLLILGSIYGVIGLAIAYLLAQTIEFLVYYSMRKKF